MKFLICLAIAFAVAITCAATSQVSTSNPSPQTEKQAATQDSDAVLAGGMQKQMQMMNEMMVKNLGESDAKYDARFIDMMIPHHEGAVAMAKDAIKKAKHEELRTMATKMIKDQQKEIKQLKNWRHDWYGEDAK